VNVRRFVEASAVDEGKSSPRPRRCGIERRLVGVRPLCALAGASDVDDVRIDAADVVDVDL
jgi:hypothetical protein